MTKPFHSIWTTTHTAIVTKLNQTQTDYLHLTNQDGAHLPDRSAGPKRVREYLTETLISNHDIPPDRAEKLAFRWKHGRGSDMQNAKVSLFENLFGTPPWPILAELGARGRAPGMAAVCSRSVLPLSVLHEIDLDGFAADTRDRHITDAAFGAMVVLIVSIAYAYEDLSIQTSSTYSLTCNFAVWTYIVIHGAY